MSDETTTITVTVVIDDREYVRQVQGTHWARDDDRTLYVYDSEDRTVLEADGDHVVEVFREDEVETVATFDRSEITGTEPDTTTTTER
jgi:hypothetical protein